MADNENGYVTIKFRVSEEEKKQICANAQACDKTLSAYIREAALNMVVINIDHTALAQHTDAVSEYQNAISQLLVKINNDGQLTSEDVEFALENINDILKTERLFLREYSSQFNALKKSVSKTVCTEVKKQLTHSCL